MFAEGPFRLPPSRQCRALLRISAAQEFFIDQFHLWPFINYVDKQGGGGWVGQMCILLNT